MRGSLTAAQSADVARARRLLSSAVRLIEEILDLARADAGQIHIRPAATDVWRLVHDITNDFRAQADAKSLELTLAARPESDTDCSSKSSRASTRARLPVPASVSPSASGSPICSAASSPWTAPSPADPRSHYGCPGRQRRKPRARKATRGVRTATTEMRKRCPDVARVRDQADRCGPCGSSPLLCIASITMPGSSARIAPSAASQRPSGHRPRTPASS
jgi:hypothetical protein